MGVGISCAYCRTSYVIVMNEMIFLEPVLTHNVWGGTRLKRDFGYEIDGDDIGECWGIAAHKNGDCTIKNRTFAGKTLSWLYSEHRELFGNIKSDIFPLLIKIIDAKEDLSIQVHPDDDYAFANENGSLGKTECWYILDCKDNAKLVVGHNATSKEELEDMINNGRWSELIRSVPIKKGDFIQIDPGTVHAITAGCLILETQQNSDITYRVYDYDRLYNGKKREIHIDKSIDVINLKAAAPDILHTENASQMMISNDFYEVHKLVVDGKLTFDKNVPFLNCSVVEGCGTIMDNDIRKGDHFIVTHNASNIEFKGNLELVVSFVNA